MGWYDEVFVVTEGCCAGRVNVSRNSKSAAEDRRIDECPQGGGQDTRGQNETGDSGLYDYTGASDRAVESRRGMTSGE